MSFFGRLLGGKKEAPAPASVYSDLRTQALSLTAPQAGSTSPDEVFGVVLDMGFGADIAATIVALSDGSASMYTSTGGGIIGGGDHEIVATSARAFVAEAQRSRALLSPGLYDEPLPNGAVHLIALTPTGLLSASGVGDDWIADGNPMQPVFAAANDLIYRLRSVGG